MIDRKYHKQLIASHKTCIIVLKRLGFRKICSAMTDTGWDNNESWQGKKAGQIVRMTIDPVNVIWQIDGNLEA